MAIAALWTGRNAGRRRKIPLGAASSDGPIQRRGLWRTRRRFSSEQPNHLFGLAMAGDASLALGDSASAREYYRRWLDAYETEMAKNLAEYQEHEGVFPEMRATAEVLGRND